MIAWLKNNVLAFIALVISVIGAGYNLVQWIEQKKADVVRFDDERVLAIVEKSQDTHEPDTLHFMLHLSFYNRGSAGYDDVLKKEKLLIQLNGREFPYVWTKCVTWDYNNSLAGRQLTILNQANIVPSLVPGGKMEQHISYFTPEVQTTGGGTDYYANAIIRDDFVSALKAKKAVKLTFLWATEHGGQRSESFQLVYDDRSSDRLEASGRGWQVFPLGKT